MKTSDARACMAAFIDWTKQHPAEWNLSPIRCNGRFLKFMDPDTDTAWMGFEAAWKAHSECITPVSPDATGEPWPYQKTFNAIAAATRLEGGCIFISVKDFVEAFGPTPDATGKCGELETVAKQHRLIRGGYPGSWQSYASPIFSDDVFETRELVTRSQAEELLAAKDAENAYLKELVAARGETIKRGDDRIRKLEADNAAQAARIKELEKECDDFCADLNQERKSHESAHNRAEDLKAKLAAAEKALTVADEALQADAMASAHAAIRAALGGKPATTNNMWMHENSIKDFDKFLMEKGILEGLWEVCNMLCGYIDDSTPKPVADYMQKTEKYIGRIAEFYKNESVTQQMHREAREAIRIIRHFKEKE